MMQNAARRYGRSLMVLLLVLVGARVATADQDKSNRHEELEQHEKISFKISGAGAQVISRSLAVREIFGKARRVLISVERRFSQDSVSQRS